MGIWGQRVVIIDSDLDMVSAVGNVLRAHGAEVVAVEQPRGALATILGVLPDMLLVDIGMPGLDGVTLIRKLRSLPPERGGRIPAAVLSALAVDPASCSGAEFQGYLRKPCDPALVAMLVSELAGLQVERRAVALERLEWPTPRERRRESRDSQAPILRGLAGGNDELLRELFLADGRHLG